MDYEVASLTEPATVALYACRRGGISAGDVVLVLGAGAIGLFATWWACIMGCKMVIVVDIFDEKLQIAKRLGADILVNVAGGDVVELVRRNLSGEKVDVVIEAAGSPITQKASIELIRNLGVIVLLGTSHSDLSITPELYEKILRKEIDIKKEDVPNFVEFEVAAPGSVVVKRSCRKKEGAADVSISQQGQEWKGHEGRKAERNTDLERGSAES